MMDGCADRLGLNVSPAGHPSHGLLFLFFFPSFVHFTTHETGIMRSNDTIRMMLMTQDKKESNPAGLQGAASRQLDIVVAGGRESWLAVLVKSSPCRDVDVSVKHFEANSELVYFQHDHFQRGTSGRVVQ